MTKSLAGRFKIPPEWSGQMTPYIAIERDRLNRSLAEELLKYVRDTPHVVMFSERAYVDDEFNNVFEVRATLEAVDTVNVVMPRAVYVTQPIELEPRYPCHYCGGFTKNNEVGNCKACGGERRRH